MTEEPKLLPCPFCGSTELLISVVAVYCESCKAEGPVSEKGDDENIALKWNTRLGLKFFQGGHDD